MNDADKLAQVLAEHEGYSYSREAYTAYCDCGDTINVGLMASEDLHREHLAAVVLAHLTAEGWAQGREEWGLQYERQADPTMDNPSGVVTNTMTLRDESHARGVLDSPAPISARNKRVVRRHVTDWEPVDA